MGWERGREVQKRTEGGTKEDSDGELGFEGMWGDGNQNESVQITRFRNQCRCNKVKSSASQQSI
jgi:hypothetical protein